MEKKLVPSLINNGRTTSCKRKGVHRNGYANGFGQTYSVPESAKRVTAWKDKMIEKGYTFA